MIQPCWPILVFLMNSSNMHSQQQKKPMALYGNLACPLHVHLQLPYRGGITSQMELYKKAMSSFRMSVEWLFGDIVNF